MRPKTVSLLQVNAAVLIWGGTAMFGKGLDLPVPHIICGRSLVGAVAMVVFLLACRSPVGLRKRSHYVAVAVQGLLLGTHWLAYFAALKVSTAAVAILSMGSYPVLTALVEPLVFGEKLRGRDVALAGGVFTGMLVMTPEISLGNATTQGVLLGVVSGVLFMARSLAMRPYVKRYTSSALMFWQMLAAGIVLLPWVVAVPAEYAGNAVPLVILLGVVFTALPQTLFAASFRNLSVRAAGVLCALLPLYGALFGYLVHDETVTPRTAAGGAIVLACVVLETVSSAKGKP